MHDTFLINEVALPHPERQWRLLNHIQQLGHSGGWEYELGNDLLYWSEEMYSIHEVDPHFTPDDYRQVIHLFAAKEAETLLEVFQKALTQGDSFDLELPYTTRTGKQKWLQIIGHASWQHGQVQRLYGIVCDVTTRNRLAQQLQDAKHEAEEANRAKSRFLATMSHEIRTPLNIILGLSEFLCHSPAIPAQERQRVETLQNAGETLLALINNILDLSKIEAGQLQLEQLIFSPRDQAKQSLALVREMAEKKQLGLYLQLAEDLPELVRGDRNRLQQVLLNLLSNALKFTAQGSVTMHVRKSARNQLLFTVCDTGVGIPEERLQTIFLPFSQADDTISRRFAGSGLGLNICCQLVEKMGGEIWVESIPGQGSSFTFTLHLPAVTLLGELSGSIQPANDFPVQPLVQAIPLRILLVDDVEDNRMLIKIYLESLPHLLIEACSGQQALQLFAAHPFDLVLMDLMMPVLDGLETTRRMRQIESLRSWPAATIVALTANTMQEECEASVQAGCNAHLCKPLRRQQLLELLAQVRMQHALSAPLTALLPSPTPRAADTVNLTTLQQLQLNLGSGFRRVLNNFLVSIPIRTAALNTACQNDNYAMAHQLAHKLKGTSASFCADRLAQLCAKLEIISLLPAPPQAQINAIINDITSESDLFTQKILHLLG
jgi:signal transduction histidine kinase/CheY-like chemotaxis protein/HPt (histidine-containing phosphotransfer) domain-containing protein